MKSYKDIDREIILNAPEGAMWVYWHDTPYFYKFEAGRMYFCSKNNGFTWMPSICNVLDMQTSGSIPIPNIGIPWEATEDSVCRVQEGTKVQVFFSDGYIGYDDNPNGWNWCKSSIPVTSYKIIDEDYINSAITTTNTQVYAKEEDYTKQTVTESVTEYDTLVQKLRGLQSLANDFP